MRYLEFLKTKLGLSRPETARSVARREILDRRLILEGLPTTIDIELTARCNFKPACTFCTGKNEPGYREPLDLSTRQLELYWPYLLGSGRVNDCSYGEPLLYPGLERIIKRLTSANVKFGFTTNGLLLSGRISHFLLEHADMIQFAVSFNAATAETYSRLHGQDLKSLRKNIEQFQNIHARLYPEQASPLILSYIVMRSNIGEVFDFLRMAMKLGVREVMLRHLFDMKVGNYVCENFGYRFIYEREMCSLKDYEGLEDQIQREKEFSNLKIQYTWNAEDSFIAEQSEEGLDRICLFPWKFLCIRPMHDTYSPCAFLKKSVAAPSLNTVKEVWNGKVIVDMRRSLSKNEIPDFCLSYGVCPIVIAHKRPH